MFIFASVKAVTTLALAIPGVNQIAAYQDVANGLTRVSLGIGQYAIGSAEAGKAKREGRPAKNILTPLVNKVTQPEKRDRVSEDYAAMPNLNLAASLGWLGGGAALALAPVVPGLKDISSGVNGIASLAANTSFVPIAYRGSHLHQKLMYLMLPMGLGCDLMVAYDSTLAWAGLGLVMATYYNYVASETALETSQPQENEAEISTEERAAYQPVPHGNI